MSGLEKSETHREVRALSIAVARIGPRALPRIMPLFSSPDSEIRSRAIRTLGRMGAEIANPKIEALLINSLADENKSLVSLAARSIWQLGIESTDSKSALEEITLEDNSAAFFWAEKALGQFET